MAPLQRRELADRELRHIGPVRAAAAKSTQSGSSYSSLDKRVRPYLRCFDSSLSNQRQIHESPPPKVLVGGRPKTSSKTTKTAKNNHTSGLGAWFTQGRLKSEETSVPEGELHERYCNSGNYQPLKPALKLTLKPALKPALKPTLKPALKPRRATEEDPLARWGQRDWVVDRCVEVEEPQEDTYRSWRKKQFELQNSERSRRYEHGKYTGLKDTERTELFDKLLWSYPTAHKTFRSPYSSEPIAPHYQATSSLHGSTTPTLPARFSSLNRLTTTLSTPPAVIIDRHRHFLPPGEHAKRTKHLNYTPIGDEKSAAVSNSYDLDLFKTRSRASRGPHTSFIVPKTTHLVHNIVHRQAIADESLFIPSVDDSESLPSPQLTSTDITGLENWLSQQPASADGPDSASQSAKMPASTTPTPPPPTTKISSTTKIVLPSKVSRPKSTIPPPLRTQISTHLRTTPALSHLNRTLLLSLKRQDWAHHVRTIARELLVSGRCTTYPEVMAVVVGAATQSLRDSDPDKEAKEQKKKRKRVEEGDISDDEFDSDGERVEDGIVNGGIRKKKMVERLLGELREEGVHVNIGIPRAVVEEGVNIVKGALREVVVFEDV